MILTACSASARGNGVTPMSTEYLVLAPHCRRGYDGEESFRRRRQVGSQAAGNLECDA